MIRPQVGPRARNVQRGLQVKQLHLRRHDIKTLKRSRLADEGAAEA
jgi:hypothetical protein